MDADDILARQVEQLDKEKRELQIRLKTQEKKVKYTYNFTLLRHQTTPPPTPPPLQNNIPPQKKNDSSQEQKMS